MSECSILRIDMAPDRIHFLKFILEGYDGLAIQSTLDPKKGIVELRFPPEMEQFVTFVLEDLKPMISPKK